MDPLQVQLDADFKEAFKAKDEPKLSVLKMIRSALKNAFIDKHEDLTADDILTLLSSEAKKRKDAISAYEKAGDSVRALGEKKELEVIQVYLPKQLSENEVEGVVRAKASAIGASTPKDMGKLMGVCMKELKNKADGLLVKSVVERVLSVIAK